MPKPKGKQAVYIVTAPPGFIPRRPWDVLPDFSDGKLYARNLIMRAAHEFARTHNQRALQDWERGKWDRQWAIVSKHLRSRRQGPHPAAARGGAA